MLFEGENIVKSLKLVMKLTGTWPSTKNSTLAYKLFGLFCLCSMLFIIALAVFQILADFQNIENTSFALICGMAALNTFVKLVTIMFFKNTEFFQILTYLNNDFFNNQQETSLEMIYKTMIHVCNKFRAMFFGFTLLTGILIIASSIIDLGKNPRSLPITISFNFDHSSTIVHGLFFAWEAFGIMVTCSGIASFDGLIITLMAIAIAQLQILRTKITNATNAISSTLSTSDEIKINRFLKNCVIHHIIIENYIKTIENTLTYVFLFQLLISLFITCLVAFNMILMPLFTINFGKCCVFLISAFIELTFFCVPANEITYQSEKIRDACYMSQWIECGKVIRKTLCIIMERSKTPFVLTAGKFVQLSLKTLVSVLRSAFSYFTVLWQLYDNSKIKTKA